MFLQPILKNLIVLLTVLGSVHAAEPNSINQNLLDRLTKYYNAEINSNWESTYSFRTPLYRKGVPFKLYRKKMIHDNEGWKLINLKILKSKIEGDYAVFKIDFIEQIPDGYFPNDEEKTIILAQVSTWERIHGVWFCRDACDRTHLSMNGDLAIGNNQALIDSLKEDVQF